MKLIINIALLFVLLYSNTGKAQSNSAIDKYLSNLYKSHVIPGFSVVIVHKGVIVFSKGYGVESLGSAKPFTPQTVCAIGSLTKSMTAMAIMQLVEQKKIDLDTPVTHYLPWFRTANKERSDKITVRMLLNNTSGLYSNTSSQTDEGLANYLENLVRSLASTFLTREPGLAYQYSNVGFSVAGLIISKVTGMAYPQYMHDKIFWPLKMLHTSTDPKEFDKLKLIGGHFFGINKAIVARKETNVQPDGFIPAGSLMCSSTEDLGKYLLALMSEDENEVILGNSVSKMWKQNISFPGFTKDDGGDGTMFGYGLGWMMSIIEGRHIIHHGGSTGKSSSFTMIDPQNETAAAILMNIDLSFNNKYEYATEANISNNIMRIASGLPASNYGLPTVKDPTVNSYTLNDKHAVHYTGNFQLKSDNVIFLYAGTEMKITNAVNNQLQCVVSRGEQIIIQFTLDFINEAFAVSRNIASPSEVRFKLDYDGKVSGLFFNNMEFIRIDEVAASLYKTVFSPANKLSFKLPKNWAVSWQKNNFSAQSSNGHIEVKGCINNEASSPSMEYILKQLMNSHIVQVSGLLHSENFGRHKWKEKSYLIKINNEAKEVIVMQSRIEQTNIYVVLISQEEELTENIQGLVSYFLNSIRFL